MHEYKNSDEASTRKLLTNQLRLRIHRVNADEKSQFNDTQLLVIKKKKEEGLCLAYTISLHVSNIL